MQPPLELVTPAPPHRDSDRLVRSEAVASFDSEADRADDLRSQPWRTAHTRAFTPDGQPRECHESVERTLARLAAAAGPLRRVMAAVAARLVDSRAWERLCFARLSDYAREQLGVSARQLQELARVHRALGALPRLERALLANELPWSKLKLLARVATAEDEASWLALARETSTRELAERVREARARRRQDTAVAVGTDPDDQQEPTRCLSLHCSPAVRARWSAVCELAERVAGQRLTPGDVLELVVAEAFSAFGPRPEGRAALERIAEDEQREHGTRGELPWLPTAGDRDGAHERLTPWANDDSRAGPRAENPAIPEEVLSLATGLADANAREVDRRLRRAIRLEQTLDAAIAPLLRVVTSAEYEWEGDYRPLPAYASDELGMSARKARALLRLERVADLCPELREAYRAGRLSWVKAQCLLPLLAIQIEGEWRRAWVDWAARVTVRRLTADVERALLLRAGTSRAWSRCEAHPERVQDPIPEEEIALERQLYSPAIDVEATQELRFRVPVDVALLFLAVCEMMRASLQQQRGCGRHTAGSFVPRASDGEVFEALLEHAVTEWTRREPGARRPDPVIERDGYRCAVPGCTSRCNLHDHHVVFRSAGGSDEPENRITLCAFHHQRGVHEGRMAIRGRAPDRLAFELPTARYASGDLLLAS